MCISGFQGVFLRGGRAIPLVSSVPAGEGIRRAQIHALLW